MWDRPTAPASLSIHLDGRRAQQKGWERTWGYNQKYCLTRRELGNKSDFILMQHVERVSQQQSFQRMLI